MFVHTGPRLQLIDHYPEVAIELRCSKKYERVRGKTQIDFRTLYKHPTHNLPLFRTD